jgi:peptidoglycan-N-acetylglucosamine deacetylase
MSLSPGTPTHRIPRSALAAAAVAVLLAFAALTATALLAPHRAAGGTLERVAAVADSPAVETTIPPIARAISTSMTALPVTSPVSPTPSTAPTVGVPAVRKPPRSEMGRLVADVRERLYSAVELLLMKADRLGPPDYLTRQGMTSLPHPGDTVALTFDDGPSADTRPILKILAKNHAQATFFMPGSRALGHGDILRDVMAEGSEIGNHTYSHVSLLAHTESWDESQVARAEQVYFSEVGVRPVWVRPQAGWLDQTGLDAIAALGKRYVFWNDCGDDTVSFFTPHMIARKVLDDVKPGSIILLHETNPRTVAALPRILAGLKARGLRVTSLTQATR